jgi:hypothetical protein
VSSQPPSAHVLLILTPEEQRQMKLALEARVVHLLDMVNVLAEPLARQAYDHAQTIVSGSVKLGLGTGTLGMSFEQAWAARLARQ